MKKMFNKFNFTFNEGIILFWIGCAILLKLLFQMPVMNFYLSAVDDLLRQPGDNLSIGLILCRSKVGVLAEYALRHLNKPIGLAEYRLTEQLPKEIKTLLPAIVELEAEFSKELINENYTKKNK